MQSRMRRRGIRRLRFTRRMYHRVANRRIIRPDRRIELIDGEIYEAFTMSDAHWCVLNHLQARLVKLSSGSWFTSCRCPIVLNSYSEPDPDISIIRGKILEYRDRAPEPSDTPVVIEVSDETLRFDRGRRLRAYVEAGLREYWIINLVDRAVEVRTEPRPRDGNTRGTYAVLHEYRGEEKVPLRLDGQTIAEFPVTELIPL